MVLAIDPGTKGIGWARFTPAGTLTEAGLARTTARGLHLAAISLSYQIPKDPEVYVEEMTYRPGDRRSVPRDLLRVQWIGAAVASAVSSAGIPIPVTPAKWKGQVPKVIHHPRIVKALTAGEVECMDRGLADVPEGLRHNVLDAIGIGLWAVGRRA